ncbi:N-acetylglucosamine-6-phosphate deacetylase [Methylacidimicrobium cyclopophantes]|uniref:N-acetylglucosamine-6-phosphate deacetylase n=1 Tax=Methylacidimicrobium cyclopophantes TaxID=1041766 RepID=A0A5E6ME40_9BACT|nr:N-acetylglucosamine-6-phosphate deacetylase [Methylacidimicrobium cyclopophantes]VVM07474.1 N-acetylglucosamine-6-phosphate deacetylase [Methylacidimicrobium cyclopophantes]
MSRQVVVVEARHYRTGEALLVELDPPFYRRIALSRRDPEGLPWIAPGLVDIQVNGFGGVDLNGRALDRCEWRRLCESLLAQGCTHFLATVITRPAESYRELLPSMRDLWKEQPVNCVGFHLEGPFLRREDGYVGVHDPKWVLPADPDWLLWAQEACGGGCRMITAAPEASDRGLELVRVAVEGGIQVAVGHSGAMGHELARAIEAGASLWTHLGNGLPHLLPKWENPLMHMLGSRLPYASVIADGIHLPPHALRAVARALGDRLILVTDAIAAAGMGAGSYRLGDRWVEVDEAGRAVDVASGRLAGSTLTPFVGVFRAATLLERPWSECWEAFSVRPARWLSLRHGLEVGVEASFCLFRDQPEPRLLATFLRGERVFSQEEKGA